MKPSPNRSSSHEQKTVTPDQLCRRVSFESRETVVISAVPPARCSRRGSSKTALAPRQKPAPLVVSFRRKMFEFEAMNRDEPSSPQATLPVAEPVSMLPRCLPSGEIT